MRICFVTSGRLDAVREEAGADIVCCPLPSLGEVSYERELRGETSCFEDVALRSKALKGVVVCGCYTDARGIRRKSAVVAERGRILGVSDLVNHIDGSEYGCGAGVRVYETACGRLGIVVGEDLCFPQVMETLSLSGADAALCLEEELGEGPELTLIRAQAFFLLFRASDRAVRLRVRRRRRPVGKALVCLSRACEPRRIAEGAGISSHRDEAPPALSAET